MRSWTIDRIVAMMLPMEIAAKTAPFCSVVKLWRVRKINGSTEKVMYSTAHAKEAHKEKKNTTGSVASSLKGSVSERYSMCARDERFSSAATLYRSRALLDGVGSGSAAGFSSDWVLVSVWFWCCCVLCSIWSKYWFNAFAFRLRRTEPRVSLKKTQTVTNNRPREMIW